MGMKFKFSTKPEKAVAAAAAACILSIIFDGKKKKLRGSKKYKNFPKRFARNYKLVDSLLMKTIAKDIKEKQFKDKKLEAMTIENGEFVDL